MVADRVNKLKKSRRGNMGCMRLLLIMIVLVVLAVFVVPKIYNGSNQGDPENEVTRESDGSVVARVVIAKMKKSGDLRVARINGIAQSVAKDRRGGGILVSRLVMKAPFDVSYFIDLQKMDRRSFFWDERERTLIVIVPDVRVDKPNIDEANATLIKTSGVFITRGAMAVLRQQASAGAESVAAKEALDPKRIALARRNGRELLANLYERPLRIAGVNATVKVRYVSEPVNDEQMDRSRSIAEILALP